MFYMKPCPECGSSKVISFDIKEGEERTFGIMCVSCGAKLERTGNPYRTPFDEVNEEWNERSNG